MPVVACQGERGAFSEEAARKLIGDSIDVRPCATPYSVSSRAAQTARDPLRTRDASRTRDEIARRLRDAE